MWWAIGIIITLIILCIIFPSFGGAFLGCAGDVCEGIFDDD